MFLISWSVIRRHTPARLGMVILLVIGLGALLAPVLAPYNPRQIDLAQKLKPPGPAHLLGTDSYGRDVFSRLVWGARISMGIGLLSVGLAVSVGVILGAVAGYYGGFVDHAVMRLVDAIMSFPVLFLIVVLVGLAGPGVTNVVLVIGLLNWTGVARLVRADFLTLRERSFIEAARVAGAGDSFIILRHLLPNALGPVIVAATLGVGMAILAESALSYLGLGVQPPAASWGNMLYEGKAHFREAWWVATFPGLAIFITVLCFNLVGDGLRDALDPRLRR